MRYAAANQLGYATSVSTCKTKLNTESNLIQKCWWKPFFKIDLDFKSADCQAIKTQHEDRDWTQQRIYAQIKSPPA